MFNCMDDQSAFRLVDGHTNAANVKSVDEGFSGDTMAFGF